MTVIDTKLRKVGVGTFKTTDRMRELINQVLDSGWISYGQMSQLFEKQFAKIHECKYAILSNSGTSALQISLQALKDIHNWGDGDQVIVPATTFVATANIVRHCKLRPVFVDIDPRTYNMDMNEIPAILSHDIVAVIPVHLFGQPANMTRLKQNIPEYVKVIEDSCESMFVNHYDRKVGSMGNIGCFSTYVAHLIVTGVGGISTTNNPDYAAYMRSLVNHGLLIEHLNPDENFAPRPTPGRRFKFDKYGYSYRITDIEAAIGLAQLETYPKMLTIRRRNATHLTAGLDNVNTYYGDIFQTPYIEEGNQHSWMMYPIVINKNENDKIVHKEPLMAFLNERGIETRDMMPIINQPIYSWLHPERYPVSNWIARSGFYVGCHQELTPDDIQYVVKVINEGINYHSSIYMR